MENAQEITQIELTLKRLFNQPKCLKYELAQARKLLAKWKELTNWHEATVNPILEENLMLK
jgi:hypothetical protein